MTEIEQFFKELNIDYSKIGFYDSPEFMDIEKRNPSFLESYAQFVLERTYSEDYIKKAQIEIPFITKILNEELKKDGRLGACIDMSIALSRILEEEGYWNFITKGSLTINFSSKLKIKPIFFWSIDFGNFQAGHSWVVAPPFSIIDSSLGQQPFKEGMNKYIPDFICSQSTEYEPVKEIDIMSPDASRFLDFSGVRNNRLEACKPNLNSFLKIFKPIIHKENEDFSLKYVTTAISAPDQPLEEVGTLKLSGKVAIEIYNEIIIPKLEELRKT
jgi:hypothetical protein